jgi:hypothetical protein
VVLPIILELLPLVPTLSDTPVPPAPIFITIFAPAVTENPVPVTNPPAPPPPADPSLPEPPPAPPPATTKYSIVGGGPGGGGAENIKVPLRFILVKPNIIQYNSPMM